MILVKQSWRLDFFRFLHRVAENDRAVEELSNVERFRTTEVVIHPIGTREKDRGHWACDGELIEGNELKIRAHHQSLNLFATGIRLYQIKKINEEDSNIIPTSIKEGSRWTRYLLSFSFLIIIVGIFLSFILPYVSKT